MNKRISKVKRKTKETDILITLDIDGSGKSKIDTGIGFLDHMLELFSFHGFFDLELKAKGDLKVDIHHTNEDIGIALGEAFKKALAAKQGIRRFGSAFIPMDETLVQAVVDISGRPNLVVTRAPEHQSTREKKRLKYNLNDAKQFLKAFVNNLGVNLHIQIIYGEDAHHILEAVFKGLGRALDEATQIETRKRGIPSTKGKLG
jgi:imidazoleglycerol-phosphate dehydratase